MTEISMHLGQHVGTFSVVGVPRPVVNAHCYPSRGSRHASRARSWECRGQAFGPRPCGPGSRLSSTICSDTGKVLSDMTETAFKGEFPACTQTEGVCVGTRHTGRSPGQ